MHVRRWGWRSGAVTAALLTVGGCASDVRGSSTPRITSGVDRSALANVLLTTDDLDGLPYAGAVAQDIGEIPVFENPDPRGPCGAEIEPLPLEGAVGRAFVLGRSSMFTLVLPSGQQSDIDALRADGHEGCDAFLSMTNVGENQRVSNTKMPPVSDLDDSTTTVFAYTNTITFGEQSILGGALVVVHDGTFVITQVQGTLPTDDEFHLIAERMIARIDAAGDQ